MAIEDDAAPFVAIVEPPAGAEAVAGGGMRVVVGAADDLGVEQVRLRVDGTVVTLESEPPYEFEIEVPLGAGELVLAAEAEDALGQIGNSEEVSVEVVPDPLTTVFGRVLDPAAGPVADAVVETAGGLGGVTGGDGFFSIAGVPTVLGDLVVTTSAELGGVPLVGVSSPAAPVAGGVTDVGDVALLEHEACPCGVDPLTFTTDVDWSDDQGDVGFSLAGFLWNDAATGLLRSLTPPPVCLDSGADPTLWDAGEGMLMVHGGLDGGDILVTVRATAGGWECSARQPTLNVDGVLTITRAEAFSCRVDLLAGCP